MTIEIWNGERLPDGEAREVELAVTESYSSMTVRIPIHIRRAPASGPVVFVTAAQPTERSAKGVKRSSKLDATASFR